MRILVHEYASGGGFAGRDAPASLVREGLAMLTALVADLAAIPGHQIVTTIDPRFTLDRPAGVEVVPLPPRGAAVVATLTRSADAVWLVAPETNRCLERLAAKVERTGKTLLGASAAAIRRASDKADLPRRFARHDVPHPWTRVLRAGEDASAAAREVGYPLVVKPARGAGCDGVCLARDAHELAGSLDIAYQASGSGPLLLQRYVKGIAASVSLLADGRRAVALAVNAQSVRASRPFSYHGGATPLDHPQAGRAVDAALRACAAIPGLRGYVGVDLVLTVSDVVVIEVNPRLTTAYLGVRAALEENVAALVLAACAGKLPLVPALGPRVRFTSAGRIAPSAIPAVVPLSA
jgi:tyramine---L-glutamate ligase